jgi:hypothetical protein
VLEEAGAVIELRLIERAHRQLERQRGQHPCGRRRVDAVQHVGDVGVVGAFERTREMRWIHAVLGG